PANAALISGTKAFSVTFKTSGSKTLTASDLNDGSKTANTSPSITVNPGAVTKLQILVPGENAAPGSATGKTGTPIDQTAGSATGKTAATPTAQNIGSAIANGVVVNAVDANWNKVTNATPDVAISSTDTSATIADDNGGTAGNMTLSAGNATLSSFAFNTAGT